MTEHTRIPLPSDDDDKAERGSLFERASGAFALDPFRPAAMPRDVAQQAQRRAVPPAQPAPELPAEVQDASEVVAPADEAEPALVGRVAFGGAVHCVDREHLRAQGLIVPEGGVTGLLEEFRIVKRQLIGDARGDGSDRARRILVSSPLPGEGKTYCSANLAIALAAERDTEVLLVDADFAKPSIPAVFGLEAKRGLMDCLADPTLAPESLVLRTDIPGLFILPAGDQTAADTEYLASARAATLLDRLTSGAANRYVIFDTPPALAASPAGALARHVGQTVLIARADVTGENALRDAAQLLSACPDIKLLLNAAQYSPSGRRFGNYYGYGE